MFHRLTVSIVYIQVAMTMVLLCTIYMVSAVLDGGEADMMHMIGLFVVQPILAIIYSGVTVAACSLVGLPIRLNERLNRWWRAKPIIPIVGGIAGIILLLASFNYNFAETVTVEMDAEEVTKQIPNTTMMVVGWFVIAFSSLHFYPGWKKFNR